MTPVPAAPSYLGTILGTQPFICVHKNTELLSESGAKVLLF